MKKIILSLCFVLILASCKSTTKREKPQEMSHFKNLLAETNLLIRQIVPPKFNPVPKDEEIPYHYDYALLSDDKQIEIRYIVRSIPGLLKEIEEIKKNNPKAVMVAPKKNDYIIHFSTFLINLGGEFAATSYAAFPPKAVKDEFGADWGSSTAFEMVPGTDKKFRYCYLTALHKDNMADVYILYLSNDSEKLIQFAKKTYLFYNLRFM
ncbi:hypothetical protein [Leptospira saintgironsiae]|uniref:Lipoprotein n=1 Tax=Leptospira saintgironsiae TaxID=2023183 RepID=A0A2M9YHW0_9LEPT|nr:hypothetical protein [Leptospira saintgironsiae]PJZ51117.1 hypothetical protein CH362_05025 [Leptospira saintgironsiae]